MESITMHIRLHKNVRTILAIRAEIAVNSNSRQGAICRWRKRTAFTDASHTAHHLQTIFNSAQETIVV
jgi:hypothetical protein